MNSFFVFVVSERRGGFFGGMCICVRVCVCVDLRVRTEGGKAYVIVCVDKRGAR